MDTTGSTPTLASPATGFTTAPADAQTPAAPVAPPAPPAPLAPVAQTGDDSPAPEVDVTPTRVPWAAVALFAVLACGLAWLVQIPVWTSGKGLASPLFMPVTAVMMFTPTIAALAVTLLVVRPRHKRRYLGLTGPRPVRRTILLSLAWPLIWLALGFGAFFLAVALGWTTPNWSSVDDVLATLPEGSTATAFWVITAITLPINVIIGSLTAFGEELGWRGFLTTALAPLGFWRTALISGVLWGVWHAPVILLGYNYFRPDLSGIALMCGFTLFVGIILQWSRYYARNVWVAAIGHGALNATATVSLVWLAADADTATATLLGVPGWILMAVVIVVLVATGWIGRKLPRALVVAPQPKPEPQQDAVGVS